MKLSFEGVTIQSITDQMEVMLNAIKARNKPPVAAPLRSENQTAWAQGATPPGPEAFTKVQQEVKEVLQKISETIPVDAPKRTRTEKQLANDEKLRAAALAKKAAGIKPFTKASPKDAPIVPEMLTRPVPPATAESLGLEPAEVVRIRQKTIEDLQTAYANGHQQEVFELLSRFGNGAKSFRELPPEAFMPIREAIDKGALT